MLWLRHVHPGPGQCIFYQHDATYVCRTLWLSLHQCRAKATDLLQNYLCLWFKTSWRVVNSVEHVKANQRGSGLSHDSSLLYPVQKAPSKPFLLQAQKWDCVIVWAAFERLNDPWWFFYVVIVLSFIGISSIYLFIYLFIALWDMSTALRCPHGQNDNKVSKLKRM